MSSPTRLVAADILQPHPGIIQQIQHGATLIFPTETIYGLGAVATNAPAVEKLFLIKGRSPEKPPPVIISNENQLHRLVSHVPSGAAALMAQFWPGALTLIFPARNNLPEIICGKSTFGGRETPTIAVRMTSGRVARALCEQIDAPLVATSANFSGATGRAAVPQTLHDIPTSFQEKVDIVIEGTAEAGAPSTIVDCLTFPPRLLRKGAIAREEINAIAESLINCRIGKHE